jgi:plastocyanin
VRITAAYVAAAFSVIALIVASVALGFALRPRPPAPGAASPATATAPAAAPSDHCPTGAGLPATANDHGARPAAGRTEAVAAGDFFFRPTCVTGTAAGTLALTVHNSGQALHNVSIPDQGIDTDVAPGATVTVTVRVGSTPVPYFCKYHRTSGMVGAIVPGAS